MKSNRTLILGAIFFGLVTTSCGPTITTVPGSTPPDPKCGTAGTSNITSSSSPKAGTCATPESLVQVNKGDYELDALKIGDFALGKIKIEPKPEVINLLSLAARDALVRDYLVCVAVRDKRIEDCPAQIDYYQRFLIAANYDAAHGVAWQENNHLPNCDQKAPETQSDPMNCGSVGVSCGKGGTCREGHCTSCSFSLGSGGLDLPWHEASASFICPNMPANSTVKVTADLATMTVPNVNDVLIAWEVVDCATDQKIAEYNSGWQHESAFSAARGGNVSHSVGDKACVFIKGNCGILGKAPPVSCHASGQVTFTPQ